MGRTAPSGTITFLFTDVEGSTRLWAAEPEAMSASLQIHDRVVCQVIDSWGGYVFSTAGDSFAVAFDRVTRALKAAARIQERLATADWGGGPELRVRIGLNLGEAEERGGDYFGPVVNTAARIEAAGHGGQVLASGAAVAAAGVDAANLGEHRLRDIAAPLRLFQVGQGEFPPLRTESLGLRSIPSPRTALVGRESAVNEIRRLVVDNQLVTLTGVGGCGKTRLAIEVAAREAPNRSDGAWFVDLAAVADPAAVPGAVAAGLDLVTNSLSPAVDQIATFLAGRDALVVMDNCEHVLDEVADLLDFVLERAPSAHVLTTSREQLQIDGEHAWRVPSLELGRDSAATRLFLERAEAVTDGFDPEPAVIEVIGEICDRLDGIPLAIELAAARVRSMAVTEIRDRLDDRFRLLTGGRRGSRQRQQTLEAAVQWSYGMLTDDEQTMLTNLSVFQGGFDPSDAAAVAAMDVSDAIELIDALVAKSLVDLTRTSDEQVRHRLLETIRLFALGRLVDAGEAEAARDRHLAHFMSDRAVIDLGHLSDTTGAMRIQREIENLRSAAGWAVESGRPAAAAVLASAMFDQLLLRGETVELLSWLRDDPGLSRHERVRCLATAGHVLGESFDVEGGRAACATAIESAGDEPVDGLPLALCYAAKLELIGQNADTAAALVDRALAVAPLTPSAPANRSLARLWQSSLLAFAGEFALSAASAQEALDDLAESSILRQACMDFRDLGLLFSGGDPPPRAWPPDPSDRRTLSLAVDHLSDIVTALVSCREAGPDSAARQLAAGAAESVARRPDIVGDWVGGFAYLAAVRGELDHARYLLANSLALTMPGIRPAVFEMLRRKSGSDARISADEGGIDALMTRAITEQPRLLAEEIERWS